MRRGWTPDGGGEGGVAPDSPETRPSELTATGIDGRTSADGHRAVRPGGVRQGGGGGGDGNQLTSDYGARSLRGATSPRIAALGARDGAVRVDGVGRPRARADGGRGGGGRRLPHAGGDARGRVGGGGGRGGGEKKINTPVISLMPVRTSKKTSSSRISSELLTSSFFSVGRACSPARVASVFRGGPPPPGLPLPGLPAPGRSRRVSVHVRARPRGRGREGGVRAAPHAARRGQGRAERARQDLLVRAERHASAVADAPGDFDSLYAWALVLQEQAERAEASGADPARAPGRTCSTRATSTRARGRSGGDRTRRCTTGASRSATSRAAPPGETRRRRAATGSRRASGTAPRWRRTTPARARGPRRP